MEELRGFFLLVTSRKYSSNGNTAVELEDVYGEPVAMLSVNTDVKLPDNHFYLKDYSENELIARDPKVLALISKCADHEPVSTGYVTVHCHVVNEA